MEIGNIVISKAGHDKDELYIVLKSEGNFLYLANGKKRLLEDPKKKKIKHLEITNYVSDDIKNKIDGAFKITNSDLVKAIEKYLENR